MLELRGTGRMERSRKLALTNWTQANDALNQYFAGNKSELAKHLGMSRTTVTAFFKQEAIREAEFRKICFDLRLNWQSVSEVQSSASQSQQETAEKPTALSLDDDFKAIVQRVRDHCRQKILSQHSRMRLLSGEEIGVDQLYVDVWVLNRSPRTFQVSQSRLLETFDLRTDRLGLGDRIRRNPGFEVANENPKLVILGKPGSGKTTFLKHLAVDWSKRQFQPDLITVLIEFRRIRGEQWDLIDAISKELKIDKQQVETLLNQGNFLLLLDGLDEVPTNDLRGKVQNELQTIAEEYPKNRFILTCRTQILTSIPIGFTSVEVADFSPEQVQRFVQNWFVANSKSNIEAAQQWETLNSSANNNPPLKELTGTPVLLSLICLVLQDEGKIPSEITGLYQRGIKLLLRRWNEDKQIAEWEIGNDIYRRLSDEQKEELLITIAAHKFENPKNFVLFEQDEIADQIALYLKLTTRAEGVAVLKAIEARHGLLIERADELWSFSHLTFQEYFTVQWLTQLSPAQLAEKITNRRWQEVVKQLVKSQQPADRLLHLIRQAINRSIANEPTVNKFLAWVCQKAELIQAHYKPAAIRAFYFAFDLALNRTFDLALNRTFDLVLARDLTRARARARTRALARAIAFALARALDLALHLNLDLARDRALYLARARDLDLDRIFDLARDLDRDLDLALARDLARDLDLDLALALALHLALDLDLDLDLALARAYKLSLVKELEELRASLPVNSRDVLQWWKIEGVQWTKQLRQVMIKHRNIGRDWQFTDAQEQQLQRYYDANNFLVELMKINGAISNSARTEIEDTLLLPWDELQRRQPEVYGSDNSVISSAVNVFISYSPEDQDLCDELNQHLSNLERQGKIQAWHKGVIEAGTEWDAAIKDQLETSQIILLLISANFIASDYCYDQQLQRALQRHDAGTARVIPIILRPTDWQNSAFSHLSPLPTNGQAITSWANRDEAFVNVVAGIRDAIERGFSGY